MDRTFTVAQRIEEYVPKIAASRDSAESRLKWLPVYLIASTGLAAFGAVWLQKGFFAHKPVQAIQAFGAIGASPLLLGIGWGLQRRARQGVAHKTKQLREAIDDAKDKNAAGPAAARMYNAHRVPVCLKYCDPLPAAAAPQHLPNPKFWKHRGYVMAAVAAFGIAGSLVSLGTQKQLLTAFPAGFAVALIGLNGMAWCDCQFGQGEVRRELAAEEAQRRIEADPVDGTIDTWVGDCTKLCLRKQKATRERDLRAWFHLELKVIHADKCTLTSTIGLPDDLTELWLGELALPAVQNLYRFKSLKKLRLGEVNDAGWQALLALRGIDDLRVDDIALVNTPMRLPTNVKDLTLPDLPEVVPGDYKQLRKISLRRPTDAGLANVWTLPFTETLELFHPDALTKTRIDRWLSHKDNMIKEIKVWHFYLSTTLKAADFGSHCGFKGPKKKDEITFAEAKNARFKFIRIRRITFI